MKLYLQPSAGYYDVRGLGLADGADAASRWAAFTAGITRYLVPAGTTVLLNTACTMQGSADVEIIGEGTIDCSGGGNLVIKGTHTTLPALSADHSAGSRTVTFAAAHGLAAGDVIALWSTVDRSAGMSRDYYREGWRGRVASVDSSTQITVYGTIKPAMTAANWSGAKVAGGRVRIEGVTFVPNSSTTPPVQVHRRNGVRIDEINIPVG
ncbi:MAG: hypothetical protein D6685_00870, partial [Bacteroidetes bacterium]